MTNRTSGQAGWADDHGGAGYPGVNVDLSEHTHIEPDVVWTSDAEESGQGLTVTPEIIVEVEEHRDATEAPTVRRRGDTLTTPVLPGFTADVAVLLGPE